MNTKNFILIFLLTLTNNWLGLHVDDNMVLGSQIEKTLRQDLLQNYSSDVRPVLIEKLGFGLNKQIVMLIIITKIESAGTNRLILRS